MIFEIDNNFAYNKDLAEFIGYGHIIATNLGIEPTLHLKCQWNIYKV